MNESRKLSGPQGTIRVRRVEAGLTQEQLAELSGLSVRAISDIERGTTTRPRRSSIALLEAALDESARQGCGLRPAVPRQLPRAVPGFVGRARELNVLTDLLAGTEASRGAVVISAIAGTAGVGKTALAVHWAHRVAERFPDGQLYVNLRGYDPEQPLPAAEALAWFLRALGVAAQDIPPEADERAALYRSLLAGRRMLMLLDNAGSAEHVRPLLPGVLACAVVVTSRDTLAGLVARDGATRLDVDLLPLADAVALLRALIGRRADVDPAATEMLAAQCSLLPLALRVAAELAVARPGVPLADLVRELDDQQRRLGRLEASGDPRAGVRGVFSWSYRNLDAATARAFRLLGLHRGPDFDCYAGAALTGTTLRQARQLLDMLARAHLIQLTAPGRYDMHDLLQAYARELVAAHDAAGERRAALTRLFDHYLYTASQAMDTLFPGERSSRPQVPASASPVPPVGDPVTARDWLDAERANLAAAAGHAAGHGWPEHVIRLAAVLFRYLEIGGHYAEIVAVSNHARRAACDVGDRSAEAAALNSLTIVDLQQGRYERAGGQLERALALYREVGDQAGEARALGNLGNVRYQQGRYQEAVGYQRQSLKLRRDAHDQAGEANTLNNLGLIYLRQGRYAHAAGHLEQALALYLETGDRDGEAYALSNLGRVNAMQASYQQAADRLEQALALFREAGDPIGEASSLTSLGGLCRLQGRYPQAGDYHREAVALSRKMGDQSGQAEALNGLGEVLLAAGQAARAVAQHLEALSLASKIGDTYEQARAESGLAHSYQVAGDIGRARHHWEQALALYTSLGVPEADDVRAQPAAR
jgi:tetratricopeptide (TPR) repeat protein/transcriptional regulator with XRE-family HTH domain